MQKLGNCLCRISSKLNVCVNDCWQMYKTSVYTLVNDDMQWVTHRKQQKSYGASKILVSRVWHFGVIWRHRSRDRWTRHMWFPVGGSLEPCVYLAPLRRYKASKLHLLMLKAKSSLCMLRVTWPVDSGSKITTFGIPKSILPIHYTTFMRLRWRLRAVCRWNFYT